MISALEWLDKLLGVPRLFLAGVEQKARPDWNLLGDGVAVADDPANRRTNITFAGGISQVTFSQLSADYTNDTTSYTEILSVNLTTAGGKLNIVGAVTGKMLATTSPGTLRIRLIAEVGGIDETASFTDSTGNAEYRTTVIDTFTNTLPAGSYTVTLQGKAPSSSVTLAIRPTTDAEHARATLKIIEYAAV